MYKINYLTNGYQIYFEDALGVEVVSHFKMLSDAEKWLDRLNKAYTRGLNS